MKTEKEQLIQEIKYLAQRVYGSNTQLYKLMVRDLDKVSNKNLKEITNMLLVWA